jgi:hypothetical protein
LADRTYERTTERTNSTQPHTTHERADEQPALFSNRSAARIALREYTHALDGK